MNKDLERRWFCIPLDRVWTELLFMEDSRWPRTEKNTFAASSPLHSRMSSTILTLARDPGTHKTCSRSSRVNTSWLTKSSRRDSICPSSSSTRETRSALTAVRQELQGLVSTIPDLKRPSGQVRPEQPKVTSWSSVVSSCEGLLLSVLRKREDCFWALKEEVFVAKRRGDQECWQSSFSGLLLTL